MSYTLPILDIQTITHDVKQFTLSKPDNYSFIPGQATEVSIDKDGWREEKRPFTFTSLPEDEKLEFVIKTYTDHDGVTNQLSTLTTNDYLIINDPWGTIQYQGKGTFLAGGAGITPFISIIRHLYRQDKLDGNTLVFSNKTEQDIILRNELEEILGDNFINVITGNGRNKNNDSTFCYLDGFIDQQFLTEIIDDVSQKFYVCGPLPFNRSMLKYLKALGANPETLVFEQ
ncbi:FAD-binding oxidoreductase [Aliifodinibius sp. S!AR15-10]|uniref:FAD-binding oxidoreductase n=1 Tax=Aliifodinibius sp. S!AR15-10 TaxID=2950437 RepID=UPI00285A01E5|nr:FAD-binding oxidoreductase [Aliifodinibius sp. S!AR15-10]MDR8389945.1 FAD-binding oxidoreductase [Aliifodinibius sp. S!AR15-10]